MDNKHLDWQDEREESAIQSRPVPAGTAHAPASVPPAGATEKSGAHLSLVPPTPVGRERASVRERNSANAESEPAEELDDDALRAYLAEVATFGTNQRILVRRSPAASHEAVLRLPELYLRLIERRLFDAELTYVLAGATWRATLTVERDRTYLERECVTKASKKATAAGDSSPPAP